MGYNVAERARAHLALFYGIDSPTEQQVALFALYGKEAPFLNNGKQAYRMNTMESGGTYTMKKTELEKILFELKGTHELLTMLCNEPAEVDRRRVTLRQEALFRIEELLRKDVAELEKVIYTE